MRSAVEAIVSRKALSADRSTPEIVSGESSATDRAATKVTVAGEARATAESVTTDEAAWATPVPGDEAAAIIARTDPVSTAIGRHGAVSVDAVITIDPHGSGSAQWRRRVRIGRSWRVVARRTAIGLGIVISRSAIVTRSAVVGRSAITRAARLAVVTWGAAIDISPVLTLSKNRPADH